MPRSHSRSHSVGDAELLAARALEDVRRGRFERSMSGLTAAGAMVTAAEIFFEHDSASFGNKWMWAPIALAPLGAVAGIAGVFSKRAAKTTLPAVSALIVANGLQGVYLHARGIHQKPGGSRISATTWKWVHLYWRRSSSRSSEGWAFSQPFCGARNDRTDPATELRWRPISRLFGHGAGINWDDATRDVIEARIEHPPEDRSFFTPHEAFTATALFNQLLDQKGEPHIPVMEMVDSRLAAGETDGWHYAGMAQDSVSWRDEPRVARRGRRCPRAAEFRPSSGTPSRY